MTLTSKPMDDKPQAINSFWRRPEYFISYSPYRSSISSEAAARSEVCPGNQGNLKLSLKLIELNFEHGHLRTKSSSVWGSTCTVPLAKLYRSILERQVHIGKKTCSKKDPDKIGFQRIICFDCSFFRSGLFAEKFQDRTSWRDPSQQFYSAHIRQSPLAHCQGESHVS